MNRRVAAAVVVLQILVTGGTGRWAAMPYAKITVTACPQGATASASARKRVVRRRSHVEDASRYRRVPQRVVSHALPTTPPLACQSTPRLLEEASRTRAALVALPSPPIEALGAPRAPPALS